MIWLCVCEVNNEIDITLDSNGMHLDLDKDGNKEVSVNLNSIDVDYDDDGQRDFQITRNSVSIDSPLQKIKSSLKTIIGKPNAKDDDE